MCTCMMCTFSLSPPLLNQIVSLPWITEMRTIFPALLFCVLASVPTLSWEKIGRLVLRGFCSENALSTVLFPTVLYKNFTLAISMALSSLTFFVFTFPSSDDQSAHFLSHPHFLPLHCSTRCLDLTTACVWTSPREFRQIPSLFLLHLCLMRASAKGEEKVGPKGIEWRRERREIWGQEEGEKNEIEGRNAAKGENTRNCSTLKRETGKFRCPLSLYRHTHLSYVGNNTRNLLPHIHGRLMGLSHLAFFKCSRVYFLFNTIQYYMNIEWLGDTPAVLTSWILWLWPCPRSMSGGAGTYYPSSGLQMPLSPAVDREEAWKISKLT